MKNNLSVVISVHNGEAHLAACLASVQDVAQEIIVVDHDSTDTTSNIAKSYGVTLFHAKNDSTKIDIQKNFGFSKATKPWILSLDADEEVTKELAAELMTITNSEIEHTGYEIPRKNIIFGQEIKHTGWSPDYQLRLFRNGKGKFVHEHVHESVQIEGSVGKLAGSLLHHNYDSIAQYLRKMIVYAENEADEKIRSGYVFSWIDALVLPHNEFLSRYFAREGYKDGLHGLVLSLLQAVYHFTIFCFIWEKNKFLVKSEQEITAQVLTESRKISKNTDFWISKMQVENTASMGKKLSYKVMQKIRSSL